MHSPLRIAAFARGETVATLRQPWLLLLLILGPFLVLFLFGIGYDSQLPPLGTLVVGADDDLTTRVDEYIRTEQPASLDYQGTTNDRDQAIADLEAGAVDLVLVLPDDAVTTLEANEQAEIEVHHRSLDPVTYEQITVASDIVVAQINDQVVAEVLTSAQERTAAIDDELSEGAAEPGEVGEVVARVQELDPAVAAAPFAVDTRVETPVEVTLDRYFAPGVLALMLQHLGITFAALALVRERQTGTLDVLRVSPATIGERLAGKSLAFLLLGAIAAAGLTALIVAVFGVPLPVHWLTFIGLLALTLVASIGIGYLIAAVSQSDSQAVQLSMLLLLATIFFSGLFMPLERIGFPMRWLSFTLPATHSFLGLQDLMLLQRPTHPTLFVALAIIAVVTFTAARLLLPRRTEAL